MSFESNVFLEMVGFILENKYISWKMDIEFFHNGFVKIGFLKILHFNERGIGDVMAISTHEG